MKRFMFGLAVMSAVGFAGCNKESEKGGPGAAQVEKNNADNKSAESMTFTLKVPSIATSVEQGGRDEATVSIDRGDNFKEVVTLTFKPPAGVTVTPPTAEIAAGSEEVKVTFEAAADAAPGDTHVDVTATPQTGKAVTQQLPITVTKK